MQKNNFNPEIFQNLIEEFIKEVNEENISNRTKIQKIRQYCEVVVRRILDFSDKEKLTLGDKKIVSLLQEKSNNNPLCMESIDYLRDIGNRCTHTQNVTKISDDELENCLEKLNRLYAYLFVEYFTKNPFGSNLNVMSSFSILPPLIRYFTLDYLYNTVEGNNLHIIDKLSLVILKAYNKEIALEWLEERRDELLNLSSMSESGFEAYKTNYGIEYATILKGNAPNMYDLCTKRVKEVSDILEQNGKLYKTFEEAMPIFKEKGIIHSNEPAIIEFNKLMEFMYLGRIPKDNNQLERSTSYIGLN